MGMIYEAIRSNEQDNCLLNIPNRAHNSGRHLTD
jgi:hypothetical protein